MKRNFVKILMLLLGICGTELLGGSQQHLPVAERLSQAASTGDIQSVKALLMRGAAPNSHRWPALYEAVAGGHERIAETLLKHGADPNAQAGACLRLAVSENRIGLVRMLLRHGARVNVGPSASLPAPLVEACSLGNLEMVRLLVARGADMQETGSGVTPLMASVYHGTDLLHFLLDHGADPNRHDGQEGKTALMYAVGAGKGDAVQDLLAAGASPDDTDKLGETALMMAAKTGEVGIMKILLAHGAKAGARGGILQDGETALMQAAYAGTYDAVGVLLQAGADPRAADMRGRSPLMFAAEGGRRETAELLNGADARIADAEGKTALDYARAKGDPWMVRLLRGH
ncbi:MAG: ankyrin repeat domain-containing protein [Acidobacteriota bacterium]